jgi:hypothetical protein
MRIIIAALLALVLLSQGVSAEGITAADKAQAFAACQRDARHYCLSAFKGGVIEIGSCLAKHRSQIASPCQQLLAQVGF